MLTCICQSCLSDIQLSDTSWQINQISRLFGAITIELGNTIILVVTTEIIQRPIAELDWMQLANCIKEWIKLSCLYLAIVCLGCDLQYSLRDNNGCEAWVEDRNRKRVWGHTTINSVSRFQCEMQRLINQPWISAGWCCNNVRDSSVIVHCVNRWINLDQGVWIDKLVSPQSSSTVLDWSCSLVEEELALDPQIIWIISVLPNWLS